ncbi:hypothetical protein L208DRAFT_1381700 [Tricholoma matsutake]|nr:hypothetical protein L208DRAFT_1381700 [Tricholoma matsutake 945]
MASTLALIPVVVVATLTTASVMATIPDTVSMILVAVIPIPIMVVMPVVIIEMSTVVVPGGMFPVVIMVPMAVMHITAVFPMLPGVALISAAMHPTTRSLAFAPNPLVPAFVAVASAPVYAMIGDVWKIELVNAMDPTIPNGQTEMYQAVLVVSIVFNTQHRGQADGGQGIVMFPAFQQ